MKRTLSGIVLLLLACSSANAALVSRSGGQAYYDTATDLTWVADANLAQTSGYDADGLMTWSAAQTWVGTLNTASYLGVTNWRLPTVTDTGTSGCNVAFTGTDCGWNVNLATGEMARMYYSTLGNTGYYNTSGVPTGCSIVSPYCLTNDGPFSNLQPNNYWSGAEYAPATSLAWLFSFFYGSQDYSFKSVAMYAWAVRPGDIAAVPVPGAVWLFGGALTLLGAVRRRAMTALG
jgi:hypothetical protein